MDVSNKIALVTGGGRGIGKGCALELAKAGADIILNDRPGSPDLDGAADEIRALGRSCWAIEGDAFSRDGCQQLLAAGLEAAGRVDILVSNPAFNKRGDYIDYDPDVWDRTLEGTLSAGFHLSQFVGRHMIERGGGGKMVFITSIHARMPLARAVAYNAAKAGLEHLTRSIAVELAPHRINVNAVAPGWIDTPGERETFSEENIKAEGAKIPWGRLGLPEEIGKAATFLCSDAADYITAAVLPVDGGIWFGWCSGQPRPKA